MIPALLPNYNRANLAFERGEGAWLWTTEGRRLLDFGSGLATTSLGHGNKHLADAIAEQAHKLMHVSNLYRIPQAERLAERLVAATAFADTVFFCNSGAEANEGMIKMIRRAMFDDGKPERYRLICFEGAFHGRTLGTLAATGNPAYQKGFGPPVEGFDHVPLNNLNAVRAAITENTAGIIVEPIQGEGGIRSADIEFLRQLRQTCDEFGLLLGLDEIQCGMGRTGKLWAHEWAGIKPDVITAAKGIGGGFPLGAVLATENAGKHLVPGTHGTTFGGNPLACTAGNAVLDILLEPGFLPDVARKGDKLAKALDGVVHDFPMLFEARRGRGLIQGLRCVTPASEAGARPMAVAAGNPGIGALAGDVQAACYAEDLMVATAGENVIRLMPALVVTDADIDEAVKRLRTACTKMLAATKVAAQ